MNKIKFCEYGLRPFVNFTLDGSTCHSRKLSFNASCSCQETTDVNKTCRLFPGIQNRYCHFENNAVSVEIKAGAHPSGATNIRLGCKNTLAYSSGKLMTNKKRFLKR